MAVGLLGVLLDPEHAHASPPSRPMPAPSPVASEACPVLFGFRIGSFGPNSFVNAAGVVQPGVCWLELGLGVGFGTGEIVGYDEYNDGTDTTDFYAEGNYLSLTIPLGARVWLMKTHSLVADAGFGLTRYVMSADIETYSGRHTGHTWHRLSTTFVAYAGLGYGYRWEGVQTGPRLAAVVGVLTHVTKLGESTMLTSHADGQGKFQGVKDDLDEESDELTELRPYVELSLAWML